MTSVRNAQPLSTADLAIAWGRRARATGPSVLAQPGEAWSQLPLCSRIQNYSAAYDFFRNYF
jgi:hypothetical protein